MQRVNNEEYPWLSFLDTWARVYPFPSISFRVKNFTGFYGTVVRRELVASRRRRTWGYVARAGRLQDRSQGRSGYNHVEYRMHVKPGCNFCRPLFSRAVFDGRKCPAVSVYLTVRWQAKVVNIWQQTPAQRENVERTRRRMEQTFESRWNDRGNTASLDYSKGISAIPSEPFLFFSVASGPLFA